MKLVLWNKKHNSIFDISAKERRVQNMSSHGGQVGYASSNILISGRLKYVY